MYVRPEIEDYQDKWLEAERELAINSAQVSGWSPSALREPTILPVTPTRVPKPEDDFTRDDFIKDLKKVTRPLQGEGEGHRFHPEETR